MTARRAARGPARWLSTLLPGDPAPGRLLRFAVVNLCTVAVLLLGVCAILLAESGHLRWAAACILGCFCMDGLDGALARRFGVASPFGAQMDSLADLCGFGVATPLLAYHWLDGAAPDYATASACAMLSACAMIRLARFNVVPKDARCFAGLPAAMPAVILALAILLDVAPVGSHLGIVAGLAFLMITTIPYAKFGPLAALPWWVWLPAVAAAAVRPTLTFAGAIGAYLTSGPVLAVLRNAARPVPAQQWSTRGAGADACVPTLPPHVRIAVVGAGFAGLGMAIRLKQADIDDFVVLERAGDVGGTWRDSIYPGAASDVPSNLYSYSFAPDPHWTRTFPSQPEIQAYLLRCATQFGLDPHLRAGHEMLEARWSDESARWTVTTSRGTVTADVLVVATGPLSKPAVPYLPGLEQFAGAAFHSAAWDHSYDLHGKRVAVIGTGASAVQFIPEIQPEVAQLYVFQRTPPWVIPRWDRHKSPVEQGVFRALPFVQRLARTAVYLWRETLILGLTFDQRMLKPAEWLARRHLRRQVENPQLRAALTPDYRLGCKRVVLSNSYYPAITQPNTELVRSPILEVRRDSIVCADGTRRPVDAIIFSTGYESANMPVAARLRGRDGRLLADAWSDGAQAYLGTAVTGYPNLFMLLGPNSVSGQNSSLLTMEAQVDYVIDAVRFMQRAGVPTVEVRADAQTSFVSEVQRKSIGTVWVSGCRSWYLDARGRNTTLWPGLTRTFRRRTRRFDRENYVLGGGAPH
ncbi:NAD(P)-binding domain-containing protein [Dactylosporangium sp. NPDC050688]|uniref:NAD(P)-binding domain-containing protein n=1 Tax=Dactylosporangium sp. NPDC050688 TaxID=3157217 RepID=UPI003408CA26